MPYVARSEIHRAGPTSPGVPPCYVGHTSLSAALRAKYGRGVAADFKPALAIEAFASPFIGPVEPVFLEAERLVKAGGWERAEAT